MSFFLTEEQVDLLRAVDRSSPTGYADIYDLIHFFVQSSDPFGNAADDNVIAWFGAAKDANRGVGGASEFIRSYTAYQLEMRNGAPIAGINSLIQNASNAIAQSVYDDILRSDVIKDGVKYYELPTAMEIGAQDAAATVDALGNYPGGVANWSGNPLFIGLGITDFWSDNILGDDGDSYDLALSVGAMFHALGATSGTGLIDLFLQFTGQGIIPAIQTGFSSGGAAATATTSYLTQAYGATNLGVHDLVVGALQVGSAANNSFYTSGFTESLGWVHAGAGADIIYAASDSSSQLDSAGVFDGGEGNDLVTFYHATIYEDGGVAARITDWESDVPFSAVVDMPFGAQAFLFNIERLDLSDADDRLEIESLTTTLQRVDAAASLDHGDTLDASALFGGFSFDMASGAFSPTGGSATPLTLLNFENAIGSAGNDTITGSDQANALLGNAGADSVFGGGGDDFIFFDFADGANVIGGEGRAVAVALGPDAVAVDMTAQGLEVVIGGLGADTIIFRGAEEQMAAGGEGDDTFTLDFTEGEGLRIIWGGEGADQIIAQSPTFLGVMVATVAGLTAENFQLFDRSMLGLGESFDWSSIELLILNPDAGDHIRFDYGEEGVFDVMVEDYSQPVLANFADSTGDHYEVVSTVDFLGDATFGAPDWYGIQVGSYETTDFISGYTGPVFTNARVVEDEVVVFERKVGETTYITAQDIGWEEIDGEPVVTQALVAGIGLFGEGWNGEFDTEYDLSQAKGSSGWVQIGEYEWINAHYFSSDYEDSIVGYNAGWYVVGGEIGGADGKEIVDTGAIHADMTGIIGTVSDWLLAA